MPAGEVWSALQNGTYTQGMVIPSRMIDFAQVLLFWEDVFGMQAVGVNGSMNEWIHTSITSKAMYPTAMMAHFARKSVQNNHNSPRDRQLSLQFYDMAIASVRERMQDPGTAVSDDCIFAVTNLSMHPPLINIRRQIYNVAHPSQGPLNSLQYNDVYGAYGGHLGIVPSHRRGLLKMIELRGGIRKAGLEHMAFPLSQIESWSGSRHLHRPRLEYFPTVPGTDLVASLATNRRIDHPLRGLGIGFCALLRLGCKDFYRRVRSSLDLVALYSLGVDDYISQRAGRKARNILTDERNFVHHTLLSLCPEEGETDDRPENAVGRACHRAGLIYSFCCVFPITAAPFTTLARQLQLQFETAGFIPQWDEVPELLTWTTMMWAIAAIGTPERELAMSVLLRCVKRLHIETWEQLQALLSRFLWYPDTNEIDGLEIWDELEQTGLLRNPHFVEEIE